MEPYRKRQRLYSPIRNEFLKTFSREQGYDIHERDELQDYEDMDKPMTGYGGQEDEEDEEDEDDIEPVPDPDSELQQRRSQLDFKLKSTFESIFEKYGRDFEGIGDEIDLETGRIVVNNGHLSEMRHERDAGTGHYNESTEYTEASIVSSLGGDEMLLDYNNEEDDEEDEEEDVEEGEESSSDDGDDDDMEDDMEDDMILRGFTRATQNIQPESAIHSKQTLTLSTENPRNTHRSQPLAPFVESNTAVPSQSQIFAQFGPQLGAQIHQYVSQQNSRQDGNVQPVWQAPTLSNREISRNQDGIDSAWRVPDLPKPSRRKAPPKQQTYRQDHIESTWRVPDLPPDPKRGNRNEIELPWRVPELPASLGPRPSRTNTSVKPVIVERSLSPEVGGSVWAEPDKERRHNPSAKHSRIPFTVEDDHILLDCVKKARIRGIAMNADFWKGMEAQYPRHPHRSWYARYERKYSYLEPDEIGEPESLQTTDSEPFAVPTRLPNPQKPKRTFLGTPPQRPVPQFQSSSSDPRGQYQAQALGPPDDRRYNSTYTASQGRQSVASNTILSHQKPEPLRNRLTKQVQTIPLHVERASQTTQRDSRVLTWSRAIDATEPPTPEREVEGLPDATHVIKNILGSRRHSYSERKTPSRQKNDEKRRVSDQSFYSSLSHSHHPARIDIQKRDQPQRQLIDLTGSHSKQVPETENIHRPVPFLDKAPVGTAPCPHVDCKSYPTKFYRLDRAIEEDSSQMVVHLFEEHRTTAFPCGELHCPYVGENGYFTQFELVEHVKSAHPNNAALKRLDGRVSSIFLRSKKPTENSFDSTWNGPVNPQRASLNHESDYGSPQRAYPSRVSLSSQHPSSGSDMDLTLTPRGVAGASTYTPMTSVSSLVVNHPSAHSDPGEGVSQDRSSLPVLPTIENPTPSVSKVFGSIRKPSIVEEDELPSREKPQTHGGDIQLPDVQQSFSSTAGILGSDGAGSVETDRTNRGQYSALQSPVMGASSPLRPKYPLRSSIPDSHASTDAIQISRSPAVPEDSTENGANEINSPQNLPSAVETPSLPKSILATNPQSPRVEKSLAKQMFKTPLRKRRTIPGLDSDEDDELNLATDGFILLSSRPRNKNQPLETPDNVKREGTAGIADVPSISSVSARKKKRKLPQFQDNDIDELTADSPMHSLSLLGPSVRTQVEVKTEEEPEAAAVQPIQEAKRKYKQLKPRKAICQPRSAISESKGRPCQSNSRLGIVRTSTPLLDLTPGSKGLHANQSEVPDSTADSSSRVDVPATIEASSSPMQGLLTPSGKFYRRGSVEVKEEREGANPVVIVRTPKGTLKKCGENGFACRKSFCFRCGKSRLAVS